MTEGRIAVADAVERYIRFWETLSPGSLSQVSEIAAPDIRFSDPFNDISGLPAFRAVFDDMFQRVTEPHFRVVAQAINDDLCFLRWVFTFHSGAREWRIEGVSEVRFDASGRAIEHIDHWDAAGQLYERLPVLGAVLRRLRRRLSA